MMKKNNTVDGYLAGVPKDARDVLEDLRKKIKAVAPKATEVISYGIPIYKLDGRPLVGFGAFKNHCSLFIMSPKVMRSHSADLKDYKLGKATINFATNTPLSATLIKKLVKARIVENETDR